MSNFVDTYSNANSISSDNSYYKTNYVTNGTAKAHMRVNYHTEYNNVLIAATQDKIDTNLVVSSPVQFGAIFIVGSETSYRLDLLCSSQNPAIAFEATKLFIFQFSDGPSYPAPTLTLDGTGTSYIINDGDRVILHQHSAEDPTLEIDVIQRTPLNLSLIHI